MEVCGIKFSFSCIFNCAAYELLSAITHSFTDTLPFGFIINARLCCFYLSSWHRHSNHNKVGWQQACSQVHVAQVAAACEFEGGHYAIHTV